MNIAASFFAGANAIAIIAKGPASGETILPGLVAVAVALVAAMPVGALFIALPNIARFLLVIGVLIYLLLRDLRAVAGGLFPTWYGDLRTRLTFWACISLAMVMARLLLRI